MAPSSLTLQSWHIHIKKSCGCREDSHSSLHIWYDNELFWSTKHYTERCAVCVYCLYVSIWLGHVERFIGKPSFDQLFVCFFVTWEHPVNHGPARHEMCSAHSRSQQGETYWFLWPNFPQKPPWVQASPPLTVQRLGGRLRKMSQIWTPSKAEW